MRHRSAGTLAARFDGLERPSALELLEFFLDIRLVVRPRACSAGCGEYENAKQCHKCNSHTCFPSPAPENDGVAERPSSADPATDRRAMRSGKPRSVTGVRCSAGIDGAPRGTTEPVARPRGRRTARPTTRWRGRLARRRSRRAPRWLRTRGANRRRHEAAPRNAAGRPDGNSLARLSTEHQHDRRPLQVSCCRRTCDSLTKAH